MGLSSCPRIFTKVMKPVLAALRQLRYINSVTLTTSTCKVNYSLTVLTMFVILCNVLLAWDLILRTDNPQLAAKAAEANKLINSLCSKNKWKFINHSSINSSCLNSRGLHLNRKGTSYVAKNLSQFITSK